MAIPESLAESQTLEQRVEELLSRMTLAEKVGQMNQVDPGGGHTVDRLRHAIQAGRIGSVLNEVDVETVNELQRIAVNESRLGIPLLVARDVIHGFNTVMPIPLGQAATWNPDLVREAARVAALEAARAGVNWTFAPMIDIARDPRWGRVAESFGEDVYLTGKLGAAMVEGFQGDRLALNGSIAACAKHFAGYGAVESGRDYASTNVPENELRNVHLQPFKATIDAGVSTLMTSFCEIDGVPATSNDFLLRRVLRAEWNFDGFVVSDWDSVRQIAVHGIAVDDRASALAAATAGVDMEMAGQSYIHHLPELVEQGLIDVAAIDAMVANILRVKFRLGLFENPYSDPSSFPAPGSDHALETARTAALQSVVLLKNDRDTLPLRTDGLTSLAVIGPLADAAYEQLGTWIFDGDTQLSVTPLQAIEGAVGNDVTVRHVPAMATSRSRRTAAFDDAVEAARASDAVILFLGEESILSGEAHSRADISLPGDQAELVRCIRETGRPVIGVIMAGRPLTLADVVDELDAILFAWHPGSMGGPAVADLLFGIASPSGKLPVTFPRMVGQIPIYCSRKNTGKPPTPESVIHIDELEVGASQTSHGLTSFHLDAGDKPLFAFGHGLSYGELEYRNIRVSAAEIRLGETLRITAELTNHGDVACEEVAQLYVRDLVGSVTRPIKELKGFRRLRVTPGQTLHVDFELHTDDLAFYDRRMRLVTEPGEFHVWIGGSSDTELQTGFRIVGDE